MGRRKSREAAEVEAAGAMVMGAGLWSVVRKRASAFGDSGMHRVIDTVLEYIL